MSLWTPSKSKRHFQLLELMVAIFILLICVGPVMSIFTSIYRHQQEIIRENHRDHLKNMAHAKVIEHLYKKMIPLEDILQGKPITIADPELLASLRQFSYECQGTFSIIKPDLKKQERPNKYLCKLQLTMKDVSKRAQKITNSPLEKTYEYHVFIDAKDVEHPQQINPNETAPQD